ncbi:MAG: hypothetical protein ACRC41_18295 [Sarcina sp.]
MKKMKIGIYILSVLSLGALSMQLATDLFEKSNKIEVKVEKGNLNSLGNNDLLFKFYENEFSRSIATIENGEYIEGRERTDSLNQVYSLNNSGVYLSKNFQKTHKELVNRFIKLTNGNSILSKEFQNPTIWGLDTESPFILSTVTSYSYGNDYAEIYSYNKEKKLLKTSLNLSDLNLKYYDMTSISDAKLEDNILSIVGVNFENGNSSLMYKKIDIISGKVIDNKNFELQYIDKYPVAWIGKDYIYTFISEDISEKSDESVVNRVYKIDLNNFEKELLLETDSAYYSIDNINNTLNIFNSIDKKTNLYSINLDNDSVKKYNNLPFNPLEVSSNEEAKIATYMIGDKLVILNDYATDNSNYESNIKVINLNNNQIESDILVNNYVGINRIAK